MGTDWVFWWKVVADKTSFHMETTLAYLRSCYLCQYLCWAAELVSLGDEVQFHELYPPFQDGGCNSMRQGKAIQQLIVTKSILLPPRNYTDGLGGCWTPLQPDSVRSSD